jgi:hypothetical protein
LPSASWYCEPMWPRTLLTMACLALSVWGWAPHSARACTVAATCSVPVRLFPSDLTIPGNLAYFKVLASEPGELTLRLGDGSAVPASTRVIGADRVFAPDADLPEGLDVTLEYTTSCPSGSNLSPSRETFTFRTGAAAPLEVPTPRLFLLAQGKRSQPFGGDDAPVGYVKLGYTTSCNSCSAAHLMDRRFSVDDGWGRADDSGIELLTSCNGLQINDSCHGDLFAPAGTYRVEAWTAVVGAPEPQHEIYDVALNCHLAEVDHRDALTAENREGADGSSDFETSTDQVQAGEPGTNAAETVDGCSALGAPRRTPGGFGIAVGILSLALHRRRRHRRA